jgi:metallo-beta-lactamase class B
VELHLTTHGFATGLTEAKDLLKTRKPTDPHPLVDLPSFRKQLDDFQASAEKRLVVERQKEGELMWMPPIMPSGIGTDEGTG